MQQKVFIEVSLPVPLHKNFLYYSEDDISPGSRVLVPFARQKLVGISLNCSKQEPKSNFKLKKIIEPMDEQPFFSPTSLKLAQWLSHYYHTPLGEVFKAMLPGGNKKQVQKTWSLSPKALELIESPLQGPMAELLKKIFANKISVSLKIPE